MLLKIFFINPLPTKNQEPQWAMFSYQGRYAAEAHGKLLKRLKKKKTTCGQ